MTHAQRPLGRSTANADANPSSSGLRVAVALLIVAGVIAAERVLGPVVATTVVSTLRRVGAIVTTEASRQTATNLARAEAELARVEQLAATGVVARVDLDEARRNVETANAQKNAAEAQRTAASQGVDSTIALSALVESHAELADGMARLEQTRLAAPTNGPILPRTVEPGHTVQPGSTLLEMAAEGETQLVIEAVARIVPLVAGTAGQRVGSR